MLAEQSIEGFKNVRPVPFLKCVFHLYLLVVYLSGCLFVKGSVPSILFKLEHIMFSHLNFQSAIASTG